jgi:hypothetical protein
MSRHRIVEKKCRATGSSFVMPVLVTGIHVFLVEPSQGVDGRVKPGHDENKRSCPNRISFRSSGACSYLVYHPALM